VESIPREPTRPHPGVYSGNTLFRLEDTMIGTIGFLFWSAVLLVPVLLAVSVAVRFCHARPFLWLACAAVATGILAGGAIGWASVPAAWTASIWTTIDAAGNSVKYGEAFEHTAERALMWFFFPAAFGELVAGAVGLLLVWRLARSRSARLSTS